MNKENMESSNKKALAILQIPPANPTTYPPYPPQRLFQLMFLRKYAVVEYRQPWLVG